MIPVQLLKLADGRQYMVTPGFHGFRVVRTNCAPGGGGQRTVPAFSPLWERLVSMAQAQAAA
jgi:hypothetical protein